MFFCFSMISTIAVSCILLGAMEEPANGSTRVHMALLACGLQTAVNCRMDVQKTLFRDPLNLLTCIQMMIEEPLLRWIWVFWLCLPLIRYVTLVVMDVLR